MAEKGIKVGAGTQFFQRTRPSRLAQRVGAAGQALVGGQHVCGRQAISGQSGGTGIFLPAAHPRIFLGLLTAPGGGARVHLNHSASDRGAQLTGGLLSRPRQDPRFDGTGLLIGQDAGGFGDQPGFGSIYDALGQGLSGARQPDGQIQGQVLAGASGPAGQGQRGRDLIGKKLADLVRELTRRDGRGPAGGAAGQFRDSGQQAGRAPRFQPLPGPQHSDQLVIVQPAQPAAAVAASASAASIPLGAQMSSAPPDSNPDPAPRGTGTSRDRKPAASISSASAAARRCRSASIQSANSRAGIQRIGGVAAAGVRILGLVPAGPGIRLLAARGYQLAQRRRWMRFPDRPQWPVALLAPERH